MMHLLISENSNTCKYGIQCTYLLIRWHIKHDFHARMQKLNTSMKFASKTQQIDVFPKTVVLYFVIFFKHECCLQLWPVFYNMEDLTKGTYLKRVKHYLINVCCSCFCFRVLQNNNITSLPDTLFDELKSIEFLWVSFVTNLRLL